MLVERKLVGFSKLGMVGVNVLVTKGVGIGVLVTYVGLGVLYEFVAVKNGVGVRVGILVLVGRKV